MELQEIVAHIPQRVERSSRPMKVVFLARALYYGGAEQQLVLLAKGLQRRGHEVVVALFYVGGTLEKDLREAGIRIQPLCKRGRWELLGFLIRAIRILREEHPDILHGYLSGPNLVATVLKPWVSMSRIVWGVRDCARDPSQSGGVDRMIFTLTAWMSGLADAIIANSQAGCNSHVINGYSSAKMVTIRNGIDTERFRPDPEARQRLRGEWHITDHERVIGIVGRLDPIKDHPVFLEAAALLAKKRRDVRFVCIGGGPEEYGKQLRMIARNMGLEPRLLWLGPQSDMPAIYNALDMVVSSSYLEGLPNVVGEAMATGVPCVVTNVGDSAWLVGDCGEVVQPKHPVALATAIERLLNQQRYDPARIRQRVVDQLSTDRLVTETEQVLRELCDGSLASARERRAWNSSASR